MWQEQLGTSPESRPSRVFLRATQIVSPPGRPSDVKVAPDASPGCSAAAFDASSTLLATKMEDAPGTLWIWDVAATELRAVLIFYSTVTFSWHPSSRELLLITCQDEAQRGSSFVWDPLSNGPTFVPAAEHLTSTSPAGKAKCNWIHSESDTPLLFVSNVQQYALVSLSDSDDPLSPWRQTEGSGWTGHSLLSPGREVPDMSGLDDTSVLDDTFSFKNT